MILPDTNRYLMALVVGANIKIKPFNITYPHLLLKLKIVLFQVFLLCIDIVRTPASGTGNMAARSIVSITFIIIYLLIFFGSYFWQCFKGISPIQVGFLCLNCAICSQHFFIQYWLNGPNNFSFLICNKETALDATSSV